MMKELNQNYDMFEKRQPDLGPDAGYETGGGDTAEPSAAATLSNTTR